MKNTAPLCFTFLFFSIGFSELKSKMYAVVPAFVFVILAGATVDAVIYGCEVGYFESNGGCYRLFTDKTRTWEESQRLCHEHGLTLAIASKRNEAQLWEDLNKRYECIGGVVIGGQCLIFSTEAVLWREAASGCYSIGGELATLTDPDAVHAYVVETYGRGPGVPQFWARKEEISSSDSLCLSVSYQGYNTDSIYSDTCDVSHRYICERGGPPANGSTVWLSARGDGNQFLTAPGGTPHSYNEQWQTMHPGSKALSNKCLGLDVSREWRNKGFLHPYNDYPCDNATHYAVCEGWSPLLEGCILENNNTNTRVLDQISFTDCKAECQRERSFECKSIQYLKNQRCVLTNETLRLAVQHESFTSPCSNNSDWLFTTLDKGVRYYKSNPVKRTDGCNYYEDGGAICGFPQTEAVCQLPKIRSPNINICVRQYSSSIFI